MWCTKIGVFTPVGAQCTIFQLFSKGSYTMLCLSNSIPYIRISLGSFDIDCKVTLLFSQSLSLKLAQKFRLLLCKTCYSFAKYRWQVHAVWVSIAQWAENEHILHVLSTELLILHLLYMNCVLVFGESIPATISFIMYWFLNMKQCFKIHSLLSEELHRCCEFSVREHESEMPQYTNSPYPTQPLATSSL